MPFPTNFLWGAAAASYQIEGASTADGKGPSIWDTFSHRSGTIERGETGDTACDHYNRLEEDLDLMAALGLRSYRFSVSWPRVLPDGTGRVNQVGLDFYKRLIDGLLERQIAPLLTCYHWDLPEAMQQQGGWQNPAIVDHFASYAELLAKTFANQVHSWITINEIQIMAKLGMQQGVHAPGLHLSDDELAQALHIIFCSHHAAVRSIRGQLPEARIGIAHVGPAYYPATDADVDACRRMMWDDVPSLPLDLTSHNAILLDPILHGHYPAFAESHFDALNKRRPLRPEPLDFLGFNYYSGAMVRADADGNPIIVQDPDGESLRTLFDWLSVPTCLYWHMRFLHERYQLPLMVTENGMSNVDWVHSDGKVHDPQRIDYLRSHLLQVERAIDEGIPVLGYQHWSLMDNFEWACGFRHRFGLTHVDYHHDCKRTIKDSGHYYRRIIDSNGKCLEKNPFHAEGMS